MLLRAAMTASAEASETAESSRMTAEDIAEHGENVIHVHTLATESSETAGTTRP